MHEEKAVLEFSGKYYITTLVAMALISLGSVVHAHGVPPAEISLPGTLVFPDPPQDSHGRNDTSSSVMASGTSGSLVGPAALPFHLAFDLVWLGTTPVKEAQRGEHIWLAYRAETPGSRNFGKRIIISAAGENFEVLKPR